MEKILVIRLSSIGDIVQASGVPRVLKNRFPEGEVHWVVRADNEGLVRHNPHLSRVFSYDRRTGLRGLLALVRDLKAQGYTRIYDAHSNLRSHLICALVKAPHFLRRHKERWKRVLLVWFKVDLFQGFTPVGSFLRPLAPWGVSDDGRGSELFLPEPSRQRVRDALGDRDPASLVAVAPSAAWPKKRWPLGHWKALVERVLAETGDAVVVLGGPQDGFCAELARMDARRVVNLQGRLSLVESAAAAAACRTLVAADTGVLHMAEALGRDVVGILGPTPFGRPFRAGSVVLETPLWCRPCTKDGGGPCLNRTYQRCMVDISPGQVFDALRRVGRPKVTP
jgi:heptosyltransferase-2